MMHPIIYATLRESVKRHPEIVPLLTGSARQAAMELKQMGRDPREPGLKRKLKFERELNGLMEKVFARQAQDIQQKLEYVYPERARKDAPDFDFDWTAQEEAELVGLLIRASKDGVKLFSERSAVDMDWDFANVEAAAWARKYAGELIKKVNKTTRDLVKQAVATFIEMPGFTIGELMSLLPFDAERALRVAVTEITRAYGTANQIAGQQLQKEFPDFKMVKTWYTNNDDLVCDLCGPLNGQTIPIDEKWDGEVDNPPYHVNCRCWTDYGSELSQNG